MTDAAAFRDQFPVFEKKSYLNAGTEGPLPRQAADAVRERIAAEVEGGRCGMDYMTSVKELAAELRQGYARVIGADPADVALTGSTTDGVNTILSGLDLRDGDEVITSDEEHPGLLAPLGRLKRNAGVNVRGVPFAEIANAVTPSTRLVAVSHVSWVSGQVVDCAALTATGVPFLLDAAQSIGAVPVDVQALGCAFYAGSGQKWLCGPEGSGALYVRRDQLDQLTTPWPGYMAVANPKDALDSPPAEDAARLDHGFPPGMRSAWALASLGVLEAAGWEWVHARAAGLAAGLADQLAARGLEVGPRGRSTLVAWTAEDAEAEVARLAEEGFVVRSIPTHGLVRVSVGAWSSEEELERLAELAGHQTAQPETIRSGRV
jgi:selenocysteine lyase/cysteine desulfurase